MQRGVRDRQMMLRHAVTVVVCAVSLFPLGCDSVKDEDLYIKEIQKFEENRYKARAYMSYILTRNLPDKLPQIELSSIKVALDKLAHEIEGFEALYILDNSGKQIDNNISTR